MIQINFEEDFHPPNARIETLELTWLIHPIEHNSIGIFVHPNRSRSNVWIRSRLFAMMIASIMSPSSASLKEIIFLDWIESISLLVHWSNDKNLLRNHSYLFGRYSRLNANRILYGLISKLNRILYYLSE